VARVTRVELKSPVWDIFPLTTTIFPYLHISQYIVPPVIVLELCYTLVPAQVVGTPAFIYIGLAESPTVSL